MPRGKASRNGVTLTTVVLVVFITLKLTHNIDWPWIWVFSPWWLPAGLVLTLVLLVMPFIWWGEFRESQRALRKEK